MFILFIGPLGATELMVILVVALVIFGPRKLPELGRSLGKTLGELKRSSEDFKRTWEMEVDQERTEREKRTELAALPEDNDPSNSYSANTLPAAEEEPIVPRLPENTVATGVTQTSTATIVTEGTPGSTDKEEERL